VSAPSTALGLREESDEATITDGLLNLATIQEIAI